MLGTALIYRDVLRATLDDLDARGNGRRGFLQSLRGVPDPGSERTAACPICSAQREAEARYLAALLSLAATDARG